MVQIMIKVWLFSRSAYLWWQGQVEMDCQLTLMMYNDYISISICVAWS